MLGKLISHEWKATFKMMTILNIYLVIITLIGHLMLSLHILDNPSEAMTGIITLLICGYVLSLFSVSIAATLYIVSRFYKNLYTDEGYLMHTLPVKPWELIISKSVLAFFWFLVTSTIITGSALLLISGAASDFVLSDLWHELTTAAARYLNLTPGAIIFLLVSFILISTVQGTFMFYASISLGQLFKTHKILGSIVFYFIIYSVIQFFSTIIMIATGLTGNVGEADAIPYFWGIVGITYGLTIFTCVIFWFITEYMTRKKLNLD